MKVSSSNRLETNFEVVFRHGRLIHHAVKIVQHCECRNNEMPGAVRAIEMSVAVIHDLLQGLNSLFDSEGSIGGDMPEIRQQALTIRNHLLTVEHLARALRVSASDADSQYYADVLIRALGNWHTELEALQDIVIKAYNLKPATDDELALYSCPAGTKC